MKGYVYLIAMLDETEELYKIGFTKNHINKRIEQLQTGSPHELRLISSYESENYKKIEHWVHGRFNNDNIRNEWFVLTNEQVFSFLTECKKADKTICFLKESGNPFI